MNKENKYFLIDICGTLYQSNTTLDFMHFFFSGTSWYIKFNILKKNKLFSFCNAKVFDFIGFDILRFLLIRHLKGYSKEQLSNMAHIFYNEYLETVVNRPVIDIMEEKRKDGTKLILVSATLDIIAKEISKRLNISDVFASRLSYDEQNVCLGKLKIDLLGRKSKALSYFNITRPYYGTITDNYSDLDLILHSKHSYIVTDKQHKNKWKFLLKDNIHNHSFIII